MASIRTVMTLVLALTLGLALPGAAQPLSGPEYIPLTPCRVFDSRSGSPLPGGEVTNVTIAGVCGVPPLFPLFNHRRRGRPKLHDRQSRGHRPSDRLPDQRPGAPSLAGQLSLI
jgi:hypothetical protein